MATLTTHEIAARFDELARQEKWFDIQDEFFADNVKSVDPPHSRISGMPKAKQLFVKKGRTL
nr:SnoaL-like domain-containing protein [Chitinophaga polysaccharea]